MQRLVATILAFYQTTNAANWAQVSGNIDQNTVVPNIPSPESRHWQARYGAVAIVEPTGNSTDFGRVLLMGGDTYDGDTTRRNYEPGLLNDKWENGYQNDVWAMDGTEWYIKGDIRVESGFGQKQPKVESRLQWTRSGLQSGLHPPPGVTNDEWILCEDFFRNERTAEENVDCEENPRDVQWSPRRHHAGVFFNDHFWVFGGRAREFVELPEERSIGGIIGPRVKDVPRNFLTEDQLHTTQREASIYKSDVWKSTNGRDWTLVTPGCKVPQDNVVAKGSTGSNRHGILEQKCQTDSDCYGAEECRALDSNFPEELTCVCAMWSPREQHAVAVWNDTLYISGGYSSRLYSRFSACGEYACGDKDASAYRYFHSDVWSSKDGETWSRVAADAWDPIYPGTDQRPGRGGHQMISIMDKNRVPFLWVFGGRGGDNTMNGGPEIYFNDMWRAPLPQGFPWTKIPLHDSEGNEYYEMPWSPRTGHTIALETPAPDNLNTRTLYLYGGFHEGTFLDDLWAWRLDDPQETWKRDFTPEALFSTGLGENYHFDNSSPTINYVTPDSDLSMLVRFWVPTDPDSVTGQRPEKRTLISSNDLATMKSQGLNSIRDLAEADLYTILRLRGFDIPQVPEDERLNVQHVCDYRALAIAVVDKCRLNKPSLYDSDFRMPWNIIPVFGGPPPPEDNVAWHGRDNYNELLDNVDDVEVLTEQWDGCEYIPEIQGLFGPNVNGIGFVDQVLEVRDPKFEIQELFCRQSPGPRAFHNMVWFEGRLYLMGGKKSESQFYADTWYRDSKLPVARIADGPRSRTPNEMFAFVADEAGSSFEYRIWDPTNFKEVRRWTAVVRKTDISWLDWRKGGPGNGYYQLYVRAVDPAGNRDERYIAGQNVYRWYYVSPTPWDIILATVFCFLFLCFLAYLEYRRRVKKAAMERYAMKRMRRKFKAMQRDINGRAVDWRTLYMESKQREEEGAREKRRRKKQRDKNAEKREKERKKREKEKELIKRKLRANKDFKEKKKKERHKIYELEENQTTRYSSANKKNRIAAAEDDGLAHMEEVLELDEERKQRGEAPTSTKKIVFKGGKGSGKVAAANFDSLSEDPLGMGKLPSPDQSPDPRLKSKKPLPPKSPMKPPTPGSKKINPNAIAVEGTTEIKAGDLSATKDTETGTKQRKVNKRFKSYEDDLDLQYEGKKKEK